MPAQPGLPGQGTVVGPNTVPANPLLGTDEGSAGVTGQSNVGPGVLGQSLGSSSPTISAADWKLPSDGVLGKGYNGVHGVSTVDNSSANGVLGEHPGNGCGVTGTSASGTGVYATSKTSDGVYGVNGAGSGTTPSVGCGVRGESDNGYGVYAASKTTDGLHADCASKNGSAVAGINSAGGIGIYGQSTGNAGQFDGNVAVTGSITAKDFLLLGADCAEEFDLVHAGVEPGSVVVFDDAGSLSTTDQPYNKRVAGIISGAGKYRPGVILDHRISVRARAPLALVGKVYCRVDAAYSPIEVGDLLTTSPTPGCAMKALDPFRAFGSIMGKALEPLDHGDGLIRVLVTIG
jgi:hypothetical protein